MAMVQLVSYGFTTVENPLSDGANFTTAPSDTDVQVPSSGVAEGTTENSNNAAYWSGNVVEVGGIWPADQYSEITILSLTAADMGPRVRQSSSANTSYQANINGSLGAGLGSITLYSIIAGTVAQIGSTISNLTFSVGDVIRLEGVGSTLTIYQNGSLLPGGTFTDTNIASGSPCFTLYPTSLTLSVSEISLWAGGGNQATTPSANPAAGTYTGAQTVTLTADAGDTIYYTQDGTTPTHSSSSITSGQTISVSSTQTVKSFASGTNLGDSALLTASYTINMASGHNSLLLLGVG